MSTPAQLRRRGEQLLLRARQLEAQAELLLRTADELERLGLPAVPNRVLSDPEVSARLRDQRKNRTLAQMEPAARLRIGKHKVTAHPFTDALYARGLTVSEWATANGLSREKVSSWMRTGSGGRRVPAVWAERIKADLGVPLSAWPHGVK